MKIEITIQRAAELQTALRVAPAAVLRRLVVAVDIAARDIVEEARDNHRFTARSGAGGLEGQTKVIRRPSEADLSAEVGFRASDVPYGSFVHDGTRAHKIRPKNRKALRWVGGADFVFAKGVNHPGTRPDPFLTNAADKVNTDAIFARGVDQAIKEVFG